MSTERILQVDGVPLRVQTFGDPGDPALLLLGALPVGEDFCERLAAGLRFVIRYDATDPAADAIGILDALGIRSAHLIGRSEVQQIARRHPERVESLTLIDGGEIGARTLVVHDPDDSLIPELLRHTSGGWDEQADRLAHRSIAAGDPTGWFDRIYSAGTAGEVPMPWDRTRPHPLLAEWAQGRSGAGRRAVVVGCGLGADAEFVAGLGYDTVGFDISATAIGIARDRHRDSCVDYRVASLLDLPEDWTAAFDLVVEIYTIQALPEPPRRAAISGVGTLLAQGGTLLVIQVCHDEAGTGHGPPWPLRREEIDSFATDGITAVRVEQLMELGRPGTPRWRAEFTRPSNSVTSERTA